MSTISEKQWADLLERLPPATKIPAECAHEDFAASAAIARIEDTGEFVCELRVCCTQCREPFRFKALEPAISTIVPCVSIDGLEASLPIEPEKETRLFQRMRIDVPKPETRH